MKLMHVWQFLKRRYILSLAVVMICLIIGTFILAIYSGPPSNFPERAIVTISPGMGLTQTADVLAKNHIIRSPFLFKVFIVLLSGQKRIMSGDYLFEQPMSALRVAHRVSLGIQGLPKIKVKIAEGNTVVQMATTIKKAIPDFDL
ncbi:MAG: endolytic transglycosylase MltG, partial [Candidatus Taylorbacteria bacterium]|nr:endolytic transglycosylase MltG [Candidatus Taylorbacteria bacterium]